MSDFVYDSTTLPDGKSDNRPLNVPANQGIVAAEWNLTLQAIKDVRSALLAGKFHGFAGGSKFSILAALPTTGVWALGDLIFNSSERTYLKGWICTTAGDFAGTPPVFTAFDTNNSSLVLTAVGGTPNANAASASGLTLTIQPADGSNPGVVTAGTQTIGGAKTFTGVIAASNLSNTNTGDMNLAAVGSAPNANGASFAGQVLTLQPADGSNPGVVSTAAQTLAGAKTFSSVLSSLFTALGSGSITALQLFDQAKISWTAANYLTETGNVFSLVSNGATMIQADRSAGVTLFTPAAGASFVPGGTLDSQFTPVSNAGTAETDLFSYALPGGTLVNSGRSIKVSCFGTNTGSATTKTLKLYFGTAVQTVAIPVTNAGDWRVEATITRTASNAQRFAVTTFVENDSTKLVSVMQIDQGTLTQTESGAITVKVTGQDSGGSNTITANLWKVFFE